MRRAIVVEAMLHEQGGQAAFCKYVVACRRMRAPGISIDPVNVCRAPVEKYMTSRLAACRTVRDMCRIRPIPARRSPAREGCAGACRGFRHIIVGFINRLHGDDVCHAGHTLRSVHIGA